MARDRFMAVFQAKPGKPSLTELHHSCGLGKPGVKKGAFWGGCRLPTFIALEPQGLTCQVGTELPEYELESEEGQMFRFA